MNSQTPTMPNTNLHTNAQEAIQAPHAEEYSQIDSKIDDEEGWDIVLGNPPYIRQQNIAQHDKKRLKEHYQVSSGGADIYVYFFELALRILAQKGVFSLITSNKWIKASYGKPLRAFLLQNSYIKCYVDFEESKVFESADVEVGIITATNFCGDKAPIIKYYKGHKALKTHFAPIPQSHLNVNQFRFETQDKSTDIFLKLQSLPLSFEHIAHIAKGSSSGNDDVFVFDLIKSLKDTMEVQNKFGKFVLEKKILMPFCYGEDIERLSCVEVKKYLLYPYDEENVVIKKEILSKEYPLAFAYLEQMQTLLMQRKLKITKDNFYKFSALRNAHTYKNNKIMIPDLLYQPRFGFDNIGLFHNAGIHNVILKNQYQGLEKLVLGILNTQVFWFFIKNQAVSLRGAIRLMPTYMNAFSFPKITASNQHIVDTIIALVDEILRLKANCAVLENEASEKSPSQTPSASKVCHSEPPLGGEESLNESLVTHRDSSVVSLPQNDKLTAFTKNPNSNSSPLAGVQNDNKSQTSFSSETRSHCDKIKSHEVPPLKASSGVRSISSNDIQSMAGGIYKGARILLWGWSLPARAKLLPPHYFIKLCTFKPLPLVEKEKRESPATPLVCHSEGFMPEESLLSAKDSLTETLERQPFRHSKHCEELLHKATRQSQSYCHSEGAQGATEESLNESLVAHRDSSPVSQAQNDKSGRVDGESNRDSSGFTSPQNDNLRESLVIPNSNASALPQYDRNNTSELEAQIDALVYTLYNLTQDEIAIIESNAQNARKATNTPNFQHKT